MAMDEILLEAEEQMEKAIEYLKHELKGIRTGRASAAMIEFVKVDYYGASSDLKSLAIISVGRTSMFGHPNKDVVERWRASGAEVMTTGQRGTISVVTDGRALIISTFVR